MCAVSVKDAVSRPRMYFGWLLGDCISETTADIPRNQRPMLQDWRRLYTLQIMSAESARQKRDGRG